MKSTCQNFWRAAQFNASALVNRDKYLPLLRIDDSFIKYVITGDLIKKYQNDDGIVFMDVFDFLLDKDSI